MKTQLTPLDYFTEADVSVPIYAVAGGFVVRYADRKRTRSRAFSNVAQTSEFAQFLARRQYWARVAKDLAVPVLAPVRSFPVGPSTSTLMAWDCFLRANVRHGASPETIRDLVTALSAAFLTASSGTIDSLSAAWHQATGAPDRWPAAKRPRAQAILAKFLGWLAQQPLQAQVPAAVVDKQYQFVHEAEALLHSCPDDDARR